MNHFKNNPPQTGVLDVINNATGTDLFPSIYKARLSMIFNSLSGLKFNVLVMALRLLVDWCLMFLW